MTRYSVVHQRWRCGVQLVRAGHTSSALQTGSTESGDQVGETCFKIQQVNEVVWSLRSATVGKVVDWMRRVGTQDEDPIVIPFLILARRLKHPGRSIGEG